MLQAVVAVHFAASYAFPALLGFAIAFLVFSVLIAGGVLRVSPTTRWPFKSPQVAAAFVAALGAIPAAIGLRSVTGNFPATIIGAAMILGAVIWGAQSEMQARNEKRNLPMLIQEAEPSRIQPPVERPAAKPTEPPSSTTLDPKGRLILDASITPEYLTSFFRNELAVHAARRTSDFIGKWMRISGLVNDLQILLSNKICMTLKSKPSGHIALIFLYFDADWHDRVMLLQREQTITVLGSIQKIEGYYLHLEHCELEIANELSR